MMVDHSHADCWLGRMSRFDQSLGKRLTPIFRDSVTHVNTVLVEILESETRWE